MAACACRHFVYSRSHQSVSLNQSKGQGPIILQPLAQRTVLVTTESRTTSDWNRHCRPSHNGEYCFFVENQWQRQHDRKGNSLSTLDFCGFSSIPLIESDFFFPFRKNLLKRLKFASSKTDSWSRQGIFPTLGGPSCTVTTPYGFSSC